MSLTFYLFDCSALIFQPGFDELVAAIVPALPKPTTLVRLGDGDGDDLAQAFHPWLDAARDDPGAEAAQPGDVVALVGTGGTTGRPKGVMLTDRNFEAVSAITLMSYPLDGRPVYLALAPLTHAAGVLCFPILACGGVARLPSAGRPSPLVTVAILDQPGRSVPRGERGEVCVRGSLVMAGYYSTIGKVLKTEIRVTLADGRSAMPQGGRIT